MFKHAQTIPFPKRSKLVVIRLSNDGNYVAVANQSRDAYYLNIGSNEYFHHHRHEFPLRSVAISHDGTKVVTIGTATKGIGDESEIIAWHPESEKVVRLPSEPHLAFRSPRFLSTPSTVLVKHGEIMTLHLETGHLSTKVPEKVVGDIFEISPDESHLVFAPRQSSSLRVWSLKEKSDDPSRVLKRRYADVRQLAFSSDGTAIISIDVDNVGYIHDLATGEILAKFCLDGQTIMALSWWRSLNAWLAIDQTGSTFSVDRDGDVGPIDTPSLAKPITCVDLSESCEIIVLGTSTGDVHIWQFDQDHVERDSSEEVAGSDQPDSKSAFEISHD